MTAKLRSLTWLIPKNYCICSKIWVDYIMVFGLEQEGGSVITPMALAHPLHPIRRRSGNKRRNRWVGWCVSYWRPWFRSVYRIYDYIHTMHYSCILSTWNELFSETYAYQELVWPWPCVGWYSTVILPCFVPNVYFSCIVQNSLYHNMIIGIM